MELFGLLERIAIGDGVDNEEALSPTHVLVSHGLVLFLTSCVEYVYQGNLLVDNALLAVWILNSGIIVLNKSRLNELDGERRLSHSYKMI